MAMHFSFGTIRLGTPEGSKEEPSSETPFRVAVLGDFSGRGSRGIVESGAALAKRRAIVVDRDNLEEVMARLGVELHLPAGDGKRMVLRFSELDDFHPDRLIPQVEAFDRLRDARRKLANASTFAQAAAEVRSWLGSEPSVKPAAAPDKAAPPVNEANLLDSILGETTRHAESVQRMPGGVDWNAFLGKVVAAHVTPNESPLQAEMVAQVDAATSGLLRALLHQPDFQALESAWRSLHFLVRRLETGSSLKIALIDITRAELIADLTATDDLSATGAYRLLVEQTVGTPGGQPWAVLAGLYTFAPTRADAELLGRLAKVAAQAGAPFLAHASPACVGCASLAVTPDPDDWKLAVDAESKAAWEALRSLPEASSLGLALPRFLLRLPYGPDSSTVESFDFEEVPDDAAHESYLWGNPALACAYLVAEAFSQQGWEMRLGSVDQIDNLPVYVARRNGESVPKPCAEVVLSDRAAERIASQGLMPLLSVLERDSIQLAGFQSVTRAPLVGRWR